MSSTAPSNPGNPWIAIGRHIGIFLLSIAIFSFIQWTPTFRDPDSFYHMKMAELIGASGIVRDFPWLPFTTLGIAYADHHLLYHALLIPFLGSFGPELGMKIASVVFAAAAIVAFYSLLRAHAVRWSGAYALLLSTVYGFVFRLNLAKAGALAVALVMAALIALRKDKPVALFFIAWAYVYLHAGWPLLPFIVTVALVTRAAVDRLVGRHPFRSWAHGWFWKRLWGRSRSAWREFFGVSEVRHAIAVVCGVVAGVVVNPYFPGNLAFYWDQIVRVAIVGSRGAVAVGMEWYPYGIAELFTDCATLFILLFAGITLASAVYLTPEIRRGSGTGSRRGLAALITSGALAALFLAFTLRSRRHVEYFVPFGMLFAALLIDKASRRMDARRFLAYLSPSHKFRTVFVGMFVALIAITGTLAAEDVRRAREVNLDGIPFAKYGKVSEWLSRHAPEGSVVLHSDWDDFPLLFARNDRNRYVCGLDPMFCHLADPERYREYVELTTGKTTAGIGALMRTRFGAEYAVIERDHVKMKAAFDRDPSVLLVYEDRDAWAYRAR